MAEPPKVVIRTYAPARRGLVVGALLVVVLLGGYLLFEYGRGRAGFDNLAAIRERAELRSQIEQRDDTLRELRRMAADYETFRAAQERERSEVARTIGELQAEVGRQKQSLAFYEGIVTKDANKADVAIQQVRVTPSPNGADRFKVHVMLVQPARPDSTVAGNVVLTVEGQQAGAAAKLDTSALTAGRSREISYSFRYFENMDPEIVIPAGFLPERLTVEVRSSRRGVEPVVQTLVWSVESG